MIEVVIGMFLLAIVLLGTSMGLYSTMNANLQSKSTSTASVLAQDKLESLKMLGYSAIASGNDTRALANMTFNRTWTVTTSGNTKAVSVTVSWTDRRPRSVTVPNVLAEM